MATGRGCRHFHEPISLGFYDPELNLKKEMELPPAPFLDPALRCFGTCRFVYLINDRR